MKNQTLVTETNFEWKTKLSHPLNQLQIIDRTPPSVRWTLRSLTGRLPTAFCVQHIYE